MEEYCLSDHDSFKIIAQDRIEKGGLEEGKE